MGECIKKAYGRAAGLGHMGAIFHGPPYAVGIGHMVESILPYAGIRPFDVLCTGIWSSWWRPRSIDNLFYYTFLSDFYE